MERVFWYEVWVICRDALKGCIQQFMLFKRSTCQSTKAALNPTIDIMLGSMALIISSVSSQTPLVKLELQICNYTELIRSIA